MIPLLLLASCSPPPVDQWQASIRQESRIGEHPDLKQPMVTQGRSQVLLLTTSWGEVPFVTDTGSYLDLALTLPSELPPGTSFAADSRKGYLRIGGMDVSYESRQLEGTIRVVEVTPDAAVLDLDIWARSPIIDDGRGEQHVVGRVRAVEAELGR